VVYGKASGKLSVLARDKKNPEIRREFPRMIDLERI